MAWLHTYRVFTEKIPVAEVAVSEIQEDDNGEYVDVTIKQIRGQSPLNSIFSPEESDETDYETTETFKIYGDQVEVGGPIVRFKDFLTLFNFKTVYKVAFIRGEYVDIDDEDARTAEMPRRYDLNGGYSSWRDVNDSIRSNDFKGSVYKLFIDFMPEIQSAGVIASKNEETVFKICVTEDGFIVCSPDTENKD